MSLGEYIKDKKSYVILNIIYLIILVFLLNMISVNKQGIIAASVLYVIAIVAPLITDYIKRKSYYNKLFRTLEMMDKKTLLCEMISNGSFLESKILYDVLTQTSKSMNDEIGAYKKQSSDYMEYINMWVHEIKTPIAAGKLISQNNNNAYSKSVIEELEKIEEYIQQVLYYSKSFNVADDYNISKVSLENIINTVIKSKSKIMIKSNVSIDKQHLDNVVHTDAKWLSFILSQIIMNSIIYMDKDKKRMVFSSYINSTNVVLSIKDNGMGINEKDIDRIFDKGFVGENGRKTGRSTGFGLYICKKLCDNLHIGITANSKENEFTEIILTFPKGKMH